jgi:hypothetical protein
MSIGALVAMVCILTYTVGGLIYLLLLATKKERRKHENME